MPSSVLQMSTSPAAGPVGPAGPPALGLELGTDATVDDGGWLVRELRAAVGLDGPPGILQGGLAAGASAAIARQADPFGAPLTGFTARLHAPTPLGVAVRTRVRAGDGPARYRVETFAGDRLLTSAEVELAGHDPAPLGLDLAELGRVPFPEPVPQHEYPTCFVCGPEPTHPQGLRMHPRPTGDGTIVAPWMPAAALGRDGVVDPLLVAAVLDCPTVWSAIDQIRAQGAVGALLAGFEVRHYREVPVEEPLRVVARCDDVDGRKIRARAAVIDEDGACFALANALHIAVERIPEGAQ